MKKFKLSWDAVAGATYYVVSEDGVDIGHPTTNEVVLERDLGKTYTVAAANEAGVGPASDPVTVPALLGKVTGLKFSFTVELSA